MLPKEISKLSVTQLEDELKRRGLLSKGKKSVLVRRLTKACSDDRKVQRERQRENAGEERQDGSEGGSKNGEDDFIAGDGNDKDMQQDVKEDGEQDKMISGLTDFGSEAHSQMKTSKIIPVADFAKYQNKTRDTANDEEAKSSDENKYDEIKEFLEKIHISYLLDIFILHDVTMAALRIMTEQRLREIGIPLGACMIIRSALNTKPSSSETKKAPAAVRAPYVLRKLGKSDDMVLTIEEFMNATIMVHKGNVGGIYNEVIVTEVFHIKNPSVEAKFELAKASVGKENSGDTNEKVCFHGTPKSDQILEKGFDDRFCVRDGSYFGPAHYFTRVASKASQYTYGRDSERKCDLHQDESCKECVRSMFLVRVILGRTMYKSEAEDLSNTSPGFHSITGVKSDDGLAHQEYAVFSGSQCLPLYLIKYKIKVNDALCL